MNHLPELIKKLTIVSFVSVSHGAVFGQISVDTSASLNSVLPDLFDERSVEFSSLISSSGGTDAFGDYSGWWYNGGLVISTGDADNAEPANGTHPTDCNNVPTNQSSNSSAYLEFRFRTFEDAVTIKYCVASNEWPHDQTSEDAFTVINEGGYSGSYDGIGCSYDYYDQVIIEIKPASGGSFTTEEDITMWEIAADDDVTSNWNTSSPSIAYNGYDYRTVDIFGLTENTEYILTIDVISGGDYQIDTVVFIPDGGITH